MPIDKEAFNHDHNYNFNRYYQAELNSQHSDH